MRGGLQQQPQGTPGFGQAVAANHLPHAIPLIVGVDAEAVLEMGQQSLTAGLQPDHAMPTQPAGMAPRVRQSPSTE